MAEILDQTVGSLTDILRPTFQSLDFRAIAVDVGQDVPQWRLVLGVCVASRAGVKEVSALHQEFLAQSKPPVAKRFQILNRVWPADHLSTLLNEIDEGCLTVGNLALDLGTTITLDGQTHSVELSWKPIRKQLLQGNARISHRKEAGLFQVYSYFVKMPAPGSAVQLLTEAVESPYELGLVAWSDLNLWLKETRFFERYSPGNTPIGLDLLFPVYAALRDQPVIRDNKFVITAVAHGALQPHLYAQGWIRPDNTDPTPCVSTPLPIPVPEKPTELNEFVLEMPFDPLRVEERNSVEIGLFHRGLGKIQEPALSLYSQLSGNYGDILVRALLLFEGGKNLATSLRDRRSHKRADLSPFEDAVVWLLSILGLRCIPFLMDREAEKLGEEDVQAGSADILASDPTLGLDLLVVDCTRGVPDNPKIDKLRNTALFLGEQLTHRVHALIVTPVDLVAVPQEAARYGVAFIDRQQIEELWDLIRQANIIQARSRFLQWIQDVPPLGGA